MTLLEHGHNYDALGLTAHRVDCLQVQNHNCDALEYTASGVDSNACSEFLAFLLCQLRMQALHCFNEKLDMPANPLANSFWPQYKEWGRLGNSGRCEKWVPFHLALGDHERFIIEEIHHANALVLDEKRRFCAMFIFRSHCCRELFQDVQWPLLCQESFWEDPLGNVKPGSVMEVAMVNYRRTTGRRLLTGAFRMIPKRHCPDNDENLARDICIRIGVLLGAADKVFPLVKKGIEARTSGVEGSRQLFEEISSALYDTTGMGPTWVKMLMCCIDLRYPELCLLKYACEVGVGAEPALRKLAPQESGPLLLQLKKLRGYINRHADVEFWRYLRKVEHLGQKCCNRYELLVKNLITPPEGLTAGTIQVQLCEWRQFLTFLGKGREVPLQPLETEFLTSGADNENGPCEDHIGMPTSSQYMDVPFLPPALKIHDDRGRSPHLSRYGSGTKESLHPEAVQIEQFPVEGDDQECVCIADTSLDQEVPLLPSHAFCRSASTPIIAEQRAKFDPGTGLLLSVGSDPPIASMHDRFDSVTYGKGRLPSNAFWDFADARDYARSLNFTSKKQWQEWSSSGERPDYIPSNPDKNYKTKGWLSWLDWLGHGKGWLPSMASPRP